MIDPGIVFGRRGNRWTALLRGLVLFVPFVFAPGCGSGDDLAGTTNIPNARAHGVVTRNGQPVADATVRIRERLHLSTPEAEAGVVFDGNTDSRGYFEIEDIPGGDYAVEVLDDSGNGALIRPRIEPQRNPKHDLGTIVLRRNGSFSGSIVTDNIPDSVSIHVGLYGLDRAVDASRGRFRFQSIPPSSYEYFVWSSDPSVGNHSGVTTVNEGEETNNQRLFLPIDYRIDSMAVSQYLHAQGIRDFDWAKRTTVRNNRIRGIDISDLGLEDIDSSFAKLTMLHSVNIGRNPLVEFPKVLGEGPPLRGLILDGIRIDTLWKEITTLSRLSYLHINDMGLLSLPDNLDTLENLRFLFADDNAFTTVPPVVCRLSKLERFRLNHNDLTTIDSCLFAVTNLEQLHLSGNSIQKIPDAVGKAGNLVVLSLSSNRITEVPEVIGNCRSLRDLGLYSNSLRTLPATLSQCASLSDVHVYGNRIDSIPIELTSLPRDVFTLGGNRLCDPPEVIVEWLDDGTDEWRENRKCD
jgi:Leucine-rich repeat (LRR) protein